MALTDDHVETVDRTALRRQQAAEWYVQLSEGAASDAQMLQWLAWARADVRNLQAFGNISALANGLRTLDSKVRVALVRELSNQQPAAGVRRTSLRWSHAWYIGLAASAVVAAVIFAGYYAWKPVWTRHSGNVTWTVGKAQARDVTLADGTRVAIGADSRLEVAYSARVRAVKLLAGEAYFQVTHDAQRPFIVDAGPLRLMDVGTAFDVQKTGNFVSVAVARGTVTVSLAGHGPGLTKRLPPTQVRPLLLTAGDGISTDGIDLDKTNAVTIDSADVASWRENRLRFTDTPLPVVVANVNRYSPREIVVTDPRIDRMFYTGTVYLNQINDWLKAVQHTFDLKALQTDGGKRVVLEVADSREPLTPR